jgi:hypothetical protein
MADETKSDKIQEEEEEAMLFCARIRAKAAIAFQDAGRASKGPAQDLIDAYASWHAETLKSDVSEAKKKKLLSVIAPILRPSILHSKQDPKVVPDVSCHFMTFISGTFGHFGPDVKPKTWEVMRDHPDLKYTGV